MSAYHAQSPIKDFREMLALDGGTYNEHIEFIPPCLLRPQHQQKEYVKVLRALVGLIYNNHALSVELRICRKRFSSVMRSSLVWKLRQSLKRMMCPTSTPTWVSLSWATRFKRLVTAVRHGYVHPVMKRPGAKSASSKHCGACNGSKKGKSDCFSCILQYYWLIAAVATIA